MPNGPDDPFTRILDMLRRRAGRDIRAPSVGELEFIALTKSYAEFSQKLRRLGHGTAADVVIENAIYIGLRWMALADVHLNDARSAYVEGLERGLYSRAYYAVYNASKSVRYIVGGAVSLKGDDHGFAPDLPDDFPNVERWSGDITRMLEHRLVADYDNWQNDEAKRTISRADILVMAEGFVMAAKIYLRQKAGVRHD